MRHRRALTVGLVGTFAVLATMCHDPNQTRIIPPPSAVDAGSDLRTPPGSSVTLSTRLVGGSEWTVSWGDGGLDSGQLSGEIHKHGDESESVVREDHHDQRTVRSIDGGHSHDPAHHTSSGKRDSSSEALAPRLTTE